MIKVLCGLLCSEARWSGDSNNVRTMENEVKQRNQRNRRRERAQRMQAQRESKVKDGDSGEDESPAREKPPRPPARRKKSREPLGEEDIIDGFAIMAFRTYEDLEVSTNRSTTSIQCLVGNNLDFRPFYHISYETILFTLTYYC